MLPHSYLATKYLEAYKFLKGSINIRPIAKPACISNRESGLQYTYQGKSMLGS